VLASFLSRTHAPTALDKVAGHWMAESEGEKE
jgi:hypothetical protein